MLIADENGGIRKESLNDKAQAVIAEYRRQDRSFLPLDYKARIQACLKSGVSDRFDTPIPTSEDERMHWLFVPDVQLRRVVIYCSFEHSEARAEAKMWKETAHRDPLTGAYNRRQVPIAFQEARMVPAAPGACDAIFLIDINNFKTFNDSWGHKVGDAALIITRAALEKSASSGSVFRIGGDEFMVHVTHVGSSWGEAREVFHEIAERMLEYIEQWETLPGLSVPVIQTMRQLAREQPFSLSIGIAQYWSTLSDYSARFSNADKALYRAKALQSEGDGSHLRRGGCSRRGGSCFHFDDMSEVEAGELANLMPKSTDHDNVLIELQGIEGFSLRATSQSLV